MSSPMPGGQMPGLLQTIFNHLDELSPQSISRLGLHLMVDPETGEQIRVVLLPEAIYIERPLMVSTLPPGIPCEACQGSGRSS
jgi:hypothetical protein